MSPAETPAALLRRAADRLDDLGALLANEPWTTERIFWKVGSARGLQDGWWWEIRDPDGTVAIASEQDDDPASDTAERRTAWIAALGPQTRSPLAEWLRAEADCLDRYWVGDGELNLPSAESLDPRERREARRMYSALAFAETMLGENR